MPLDVELAEVRDFLARHEPFAGLPAAALESLPARMSVEYFRRGTEIIARGQDNHHLYVLRSAGHLPHSVVWGVIAWMTVFGSLGAWRMAREVRMDDIEPTLG